MRKELIVYYVGSAVAAIAPFFIDSTEGKIAEIVGLSVLTAQVWRKRQYNLVILNTISVIGYIVAILVKEEGCMICQG